MPDDSFVKCFVRKRVASPPDGGDIVPRAHLEGFLSHPVAGISATAAVATMTEIRLAVFAAEVIIHNI